MMSRAVGHKQRQDEFEQKKITDVMDIRYKNALIQQMSDRTRIGEVNAARQLTDAMRMSPVEVMGKGLVSFEQWKALPPGVREYAYYSYTEKLRGETPLTYNEFNNQTTDPVKKQYYDLGKKDSEFADWLVKYNESSAANTTVNVGERAEASGLGKSKAKVQAPETIQTIRDNLAKKGADWHIPEGADKLAVKLGVSVEEATELLQNRQVLKELDDWVRQAFKGEDVEFKKDGWYIGDKLIRRNPYYVK